MSPELIDENSKLPDATAEQTELSVAALLWVAGVMIVVIALMFASVYGKGYLSYGGVAFGVMTGIIIHLVVIIISRSPRTIKLLVVHGIIWVIAVSFAVILRSNRDERELAQFGKVYYAPVIDLYKIRTKRRGIERRFRARIQYEVQGKVYVKSIINQDRYLELSDTVKIVYSSRDPLLFGVSAYIKRHIPGTADTASFQNMGGSASPGVAPIVIAGDRFPQFKGGSNAFYTYVSQHLVYPPVGIVGRRAGQVRLSFVVDRDGSIKDVHVINGMGSPYDEAAVKVLQDSPKWLPGILKGKAVKVKYNIPIRFSL